MSNHSHTFSLADQISLEQDRRKIKALVDSGELDAEQLANAPIVQMDGKGPDDPGEVVSVTCQTDGCGAVFRNMQAFELHLNDVHLNGDEE